MMHELFIALSGNESSIFHLGPNCITKSASFLSNQTEIKQNNEYKAKESHKPIQVHSAEIICESFSTYFHPCEKNIIEEILIIAQLHRKIIEFHNKFTFESENNDNKPGHYITSLSTAIYDETKPYRKKIVRLEQEFLENPQSLISTLLLDIRPFQHVFEQLCFIIDEVETRKLHGCCILDALHKAVILAVGEAQNVLKRIRVSVQKVLVEQLNYWLLYGELLDPHEEFFIKIYKNETTGGFNCKEDGVTSPNKIIEARLEVEMLPDFIPLSTAENILFIGESILCFAREEEGNGLGLRNGDGHQKEQLIDKFNSISLLDCSSISTLLNLIEEERKSVAEGLYSLVLNSGFEENLNHIKNIYLLGRGELYHAFFNIVDCSQINCFNINGIFQKAGRLVMLPESFLDKVTISLLKENSYKSSDDLCKNMHIEYKVNWPLHKIFNSSTLHKYNNISRFLLGIQRVQSRLRELWLNQKQDKENQSRNFWILCLTLRHHMSLLIYNIQYYLQVDVLDSQFNELKKVMKVTRDYQSLCFHHDAFLSSVTVQCFLSHPHVSNTIALILDKVNEFCSLLLSLNKPTDIEEKVKSLKKEFDGASTKFFWSLNSLCQTKNGRYTGQLVMRIDYNKFYSKRIRDNRIYPHSDDDDA